MNPRLLKKALNEEAYHLASKGHADPHTRAVESILKKLSTPYWYREMPIRPEHIDEYEAKVAELSAGRSSI